MREAPESGSDNEDVEAVLAGDSNRFARIVQRHEKSLQRAAHSRLGDAEAAEETVQETFFCAYKSLHSYKSSFSFRTWLWTILLNQCRRFVKKRSRRPFVHSWTDQTDGSAPSFGCADDLESSEVDPPGRLMAKERQQQLESLLSQLPETQADALRLRFFGELKFQEIAAVMNCSLSSAKNRVRWGLQKMSSMMHHETSGEMNPKAENRSEL